MRTHLKQLAWNTIVSLSSCALGLAIAAGLCSIGLPVVLAAVVGAAAYIGALLANVK